MEPGPNADVSLTTRRAIPASLRTVVNGITDMNERSINRQQLPNGHTSILSPAFRYVPAVKTDLSKTFARIREQRVALQAGGNVSVLKTKRSG